MLTAVKLRAFSLVELLVVLAILTLLIALLMPVLAKARQAAKTSSNISNIRQIHMGLIGYAQDHRRSLPYQRMARFNPSNNVPYWAGLLAGMAYVNDPFIFWGPFRDRSWFDDGQFTSTAATRANPKQSIMYERSGYGVSHFLMPPWHTGNASNPILMKTHRLGNVIPTHSDAGIDNPAPSRVAMLSEFFANTTNPYKYGWWAGPGPNAWLYTQSGAVATGYLDGHAINTNSQTLGWIATSSATGQWNHVNSTVTFRKEPWFRPD